MSATTTLLTFEQFERVPDQPGKDELLDGEWIHLPPAFLQPMRIVHRLYEILKAIVEKVGAAAGLGGVYMETGYKLGRRTWLQPDVSIAHFHQSGSQYFEGAPALAVEVISESNTAEMMDRKVKAYLANGARGVWVVYPKTRCIWLFQADGAREFRDVLQSNLAGELRLELEQIFDANTLG